MALKICLLLLGCVSVAVAQPVLGATPGVDLGPVYTLRTFLPRRNMNDSMALAYTFNSSVFSREVHYEWENYDGWYNNPAHPEWGGADFPLERKTPIVYSDGVYEIIEEAVRGNVLVISNLTQHGLSGLGSSRRTAFFIFFGQQVVEEMLDAQRPGCIPEYENMRVPKCHALYDPDCRSERIIPFLRNRYDFGTGYAPNNPRQQLNEITPWLDGGLVYGPVKAWTDAIRAFNKGYLAVINTTRENDPPIFDNLDLANAPISNMFPSRNDIGLPLANPPPPANASLFPVNRFWTIGNPRGDENPFLLTMGILWFRVHQFWARRLYESYETLPMNMREEEFEEDEWLFNRARQFTIATYQHIVYDEWLPIFLPRKFPNGAQIPYAMNPGYSAYFNRTGYNPAINPQVAHIFQSAAMRFGHTMVTPGVWRRQQADNPLDCLFGSTLSNTFDRTNSFLKRLDPQGGPFTRYETWQNLTSRFLTSDSTDPTTTAIRSFLEKSIYNRSGSVPTDANNMPYIYDNSGSGAHFAVRTCNSFWNPQVTVSQTNVDPFYLGMSSQATEREDTIITPDLRGKVFGPLDFTRRDLMAINMQRARDHGLPDFNAARLAYGLRRLESFEELNPLYGRDPIVTKNIEDLRDVYNNDIDRCDIWACGLAETIPSDVNDPDLPGLSDISGPGELFTEVLFDQFMRIRHGDRFWWENYEANGIFTAEEFEAIRRLTIKDIIVLITNIRNNDISDNPFVIDQNTVCPQPFQLSELYMDDCTSLNEFDYYVQSVWEVPVVWGVTFLYIAIVIMILFILAAYNQHRRAQILALGRTSRAKKIEGTDVTGGDGEVLVFWELFAGNKSEKRQVSIKFGPGKRMKIFFGDAVLREIDLRHQSKLTIQRPFDDYIHLDIKIPHEYDIVLRCANALDRTTFIDKLQSFFTDIGLGHEIEEPQKKVMLRMVYTKRDRQRLLENFFKSVFREGAQGSTITVGETRSDILECELTREEFADAMSLKRDSLFVDQMYQLIDQDGNGFISFREFLDMIVIFAKGSPEDKIKLMFDMYDIDRSGELDKSEFKKMLKAMMELVNASVSPDQMDQLINQMFESAGFQNKQSLTLEDFNVLLRDHKEELSTARLNVTGYDVPDVEIEKKAPDSEGAAGEAVPSRYRARETATARARRTIIRAYGKDQKSPSEKGSSGAPVEAGPTFDIPIQKRKLSGSALGRRIAVFLRYVENYKLHIFYVTLFQLVVAGIFIERAYYYSVEREHAGLRRIAGYGVTITRGAASGMMFTYSVLLLTMARNFITHLRETIFNYYVPFDSYISFHKIVALTALFFTIMHGIGHGINFYHISTQTANDLTCIFREVYHRTHTLPKFSYWLFLTMTGFAAFVLTLITVIIFVFATQYARRYTYQAFWYTHHLYVIFYILSFLHGSGRLVQDPLFGNFFLGPGIVYAIDLLISVSRRKHEVAVVRADILPSQVIGIYFKRPITFDYKAGQWLKVASAAQNPGEFHSFTISSAPSEEYLSLHIRAVGPWTYNFREHYNPANLRGQPFPKLYLDGPFGEGHQDWFRYEVAILVGGGIGVTPFASILKELVHRFNIGARIDCRKVFFIWVTRTQKQWEWFTEIIRDVEEADKKNLVETHIFITQFFDKFDLRTTMLYICERHFQKISGKSLFTGLRGTTHFGRPDFNQFFDNLQEEYILLPKIGVFSCGPPGMTNGVEDACAATNRYEGPAFLHHFENF